MHYQHIYTYIHLAYLLLTYVKLGVEDFKAIFIHIEVRFSRTSLANPSWFDYISWLCFYSSCCTNPLSFHSGLHFIPVGSFSLSWPMISASRSNYVVYWRSSCRIFCLICDISVTAKYINLVCRSGPLLFLLAYCRAYGKLAHTASTT